MIRPNYLGNTAVQTVMKLLIGESAVRDACLSMKWDHMIDVLILSLLAFIAIMPTLYALVLLGLWGACDSTMFNVLRAMLRIRPLIAGGLFAWWLSTDPTTLLEWQSFTYSIWSDSALPDLVLRVRIDLLALLFLTVEASLTALLFPTLLPDISGEAQVKETIDRRRTWLLFIALVGMADVFVLSSQMLLTLCCGILIGYLDSRLCDSSQIKRALPTSSANELYSPSTHHQKSAVSRWGELALWLMLLLTWEHFGTGTFDALCDHDRRFAVHRENPAILGAISCCAIVFTMAYARLFPFSMFARSRSTSEDEAAIDEQSLDWRLDCLSRSLILHPLGFWMLYRLAPLWSPIPLACQLLCLTGAVTALLSIFQAAITPERRDIPKWCSTAHLGLVAMLFSLGTPTCLFMGIMIVICHAPARLLFEWLTIERVNAAHRSPDEMVPESVSNRQAIPVSWSVLGSFLALIVLTGGAGGQGTILSLLAEGDLADQISSSPGIYSLIVQSYAWLAIIVLSCECWGLLRWRYSMCDQSAKRMKMAYEPTLVSTMGLLLLTIAGGVISSWKFDETMRLLVPLGISETLAMDVSLLGILLAGVMLSAVSTRLLYVQNPEWRPHLHRLSKPFEPIARRQFYLHDLRYWLLLMPVESLIDLIEFCESRLFPGIWRFPRRVGSWFADQFLSGLEHDDVRLYGLSALLTTIVMICLFWWTGT